MPFFYEGPSLLMMVFGGLSTLFWLALLAVLIWALVRWLAPRANATHPFTPVYNPGTPTYQPTAMEILSQRFARGEISAEEFDHMRERLQTSQEQSQQAQHR